MEKTRKWRFGFKRWLVLALIILGVIGANLYPPIRPHIQVAPEIIGQIAGFQNPPALRSFYLPSGRPAQEIPGAEPPGTQISPKRMV